ncbi:isochorismatase family protein [Paracoccus pantotrophus]|uniref:isochorismatase family protein n=1 Tax=Paracoccus pantotrophus TaxID=82367 RepID=UPI0008E2F902|nr:isochorismatase family protein [Paracoccus pantotrophus]MDF3856564.1 isochorismatase family protein [Paracoccus pantotrophus]SFP24092.1 Nicotinamidase-related amidase [Paracoccus pantotrophus]
MSLIDPTRSLLLLIDFQARLMPAMHEAEAALRNAGRLLEAAEMLGVPGLLTEQNPTGLGPTVEQLPTGDAPVVAKQSFGACGEEGFADRIPAEAQVIVAGWEAHVCVLQTVLGLLGAGHQVHVVADAIGSRQPESKETAIRRMERHGAEIVSTEMVLFEWLRTAKHPRFREVAALIR